MALRSLSLTVLAASTALFAQPVGDKVPGFDSALLDRATDPCDNFYQFACGTWLSDHAIPADRSLWGRFDQLEQRNKDALRAILEESARKRGPDRRIGDYYSACMDETAADRRGATPLKPWFAKIDKLKDKAGLAPLLAELHLAGAAAGFAFGAQPDFKNSSTWIAAVVAGGLSLPDRDYYFDAKHEKIRGQFVEHMTKMFALSGDSQQDAAARAKAVFDFEKSLAEASLDRVSRRDPAKIYHKQPVVELAAQAPGFGWEAYFRATGAPKFDSLNVAQPAFAKRVASLAETAGLDAWRAYLRWQVLTVSAPALSKALVQEDFDFFRKTLRGVRQMPPRWRRCTEQVDGALGEALGQLYVEKMFKQESRQRMTVMVEMLGKAMDKDIRELPWMTPATKERALEKLKAVTNKIGHPAKWRDYSRIKIVRNDPLGNAVRARQEDSRHDLARIGQPVDKLEWNMTPPTVNAYYSPLNNSINFPAGILQPPFFDAKLDDAVNYGAIGAVIGHELSHGFDDQGRKYDPKGNLSDWWTAADAAEFERRAQCFVDQYSKYQPVKGVNQNGKLTLGEDTADNGGLRIAYMALMMLVAGKEMPKVDGFTPEQRFFLGWGQVWCRKATDEAAKLRAATDPHSAAQFRVNGVVSNMPEFRQAFGCAVGRPMARENACRVW